MNAFWILVFLITVSGYFALAESGNRHAALTPAIKKHPSRLLAATQTGVTVAALLCCTFGEIAPEESRLLGNTFRLKDRHVAAIILASPIDGPNSPTA